MKKEGVRELAPKIFFGIDTIIGQELGYASALSAQPSHVAQLLKQAQHVHTVSVTVSTTAVSTTAGTAQVQVPLSFRTMHSHSQTSSHTSNCHYHASQSTPQHKVYLLTAQSLSQSQETIAHLLLNLAPFLGTVGWPSPMPQIVQSSVHAKWCLYYPYDIYDPMSSIFLHCFLFMKNVSTCIKCVST